MAGRKLIDITGQRFGRLKVLRYVGSSRWECKCDCGAIVYPLGGNLRKGDIRSCGCLRKEVTGDNHRLHGETSTRFITYGKLCAQGVIIPIINAIDYTVVVALLCVRSGRNTSHSNFGL